MVAAYSCVGAGGAVSHPRTLIPNVLPGRGLEAGSPSRFVFQLMTARNLQIPGKHLFRGPCSQEIRVQPALLVHKAIHPYVHDHAERQERK